MLQTSRLAALHWVPQSLFAKARYYRSSYVPSFSVLRICVCLHNLWSSATAFAKTGTAFSSRPTDSSAIRENVNKAQRGETPHGFVQALPVTQALSSSLA
ncbi:hypothetical protein PM082_006186 [Marasmius tenuissimus]|nr:hypothetical protein PM082_006186 [Marasmius tenuissimus]